MFNIETTNTLPQQADTVLGHLSDDLTSRCILGEKEEEDLIKKKEEEHWLYRKQKTVWRLRWVGEITSSLAACT